MQRMLVVGGCHVAADRGPNLVDFAVQDFGPVEVRRLARIQTKYPDRILDECVNWEPGILVLQLGSWETSRGVTGYLRTRFAAGKPANRGKHASTSDGLAIPPAGFSWFAGQAVRSLCDAMSFHRIVDVRLIGRQVDGLFSRIATLKISSVLVLGALPCADRVILSYRRKLSAMTEIGALKYGFRFVDVLRLFHLAQRAGYSRTELFADRTHLSVTGHMLAGKLLGAALRDAVTATERPWTPASRTCR